MVILRLDMIYLYLYIYIYIYGHNFNIPPDVSIIIDLVEEKTQTKYSIPRFGSQNHNFRFSFQSIKPICWFQNLGKLVFHSESLFSRWNPSCFLHFFMVTSVTSLALQSPRSACDHAAPPRTCLRPVAIFMVLLLLLLLMLCVSEVGLSAAGRMLKSWNRGTFFSSQKSLPMRSVTDKNLMNMDIYSHLTQWSFFKKSSIIDHINRHLCSYPKEKINIEVAVTRP